MDYLITILLLLPAVAFAAARSTWLVDYVFFILAFNRGIRRIVDYYVNHAFNPMSPISIAPLVISGLLVAVFLSRFRMLVPRVKVIFYLFFGACAYGFLIGFVQNSFAAVFQLAEYLSLIGLTGFIATANASPEIADRWVKSAGWAAVGVAAYGWYQYFHPPLWDGFWMEQTGMIGYLGFPEPTKIVVFSTMAERGPFASFLAAATIPMIIGKRWRNLGGWFSVAFILSIVPLSYVRTALIGVALVVLINPVVNRGRGVLAILLCAALVFIGVEFGADKLPTSEEVLARYQTLGSLTEDSSFQGRLQIADMGLAMVLSHPLGFGFGATGMAGRVNTGTLSSGAKFSDNGYFSLLLDYGWLGGVLFFSALWLIWKEIASRMKEGIDDDYMRLARSWFLASLVLQYVANVYVGAFLFWIFVGMALTSRNDPVVRRWLANKALEKQVAAAKNPLVSPTHAPTA